MTTTPARSNTAQIELERNAPNAPLHPVVAKLRDLRHAAGLTLEQVARVHGIPGVVLGSYERGDRRPSIDRVQEVLDIYGYDLIAVPKARPNGRTVRTAEQMTAMLRAIADQLDPDQLPAAETS